MKKILVVNVNWMGDVIFSAPVFKALKKAYPRAEIVSLAVPRVGDVLASIPHIDRVILYDEEGKDRSPLAKGRLISQLKKEQFDIAFLLHRSFTRALLVTLAGIPQRVGYDEKNRGRFLTHKVKPLNGIVHRSDHYLQVIESYGIRVEDRRCELIFTEESQRYVDDLLRKEGVATEDFLAVVNPGGNWDLKRWPKEKFAELIDRLHKDCQAKVVVSGALNDLNLANEIARLTDRKPIITAGKSDLNQLLALMRRANVVISADSGPLHLAHGVGAKVIGVFGPTRPEVTGPRGSGKSLILQRDVGCNPEPCYHLQCPDNICMRSINVDDVIDAVQKIRN